MAVCRHQGELAGSDDKTPPRHIDLHLLRIIEAITTWATTPDRTPAPEVPSSNGGSRHVLSLIHQQIGEPEFPNWTYHGVIDAEDSSLVIVAYNDDGTALLRDQEAGARGLFTWGYAGRGPSTLAASLATHAAGPLLRCELPGKRRPRSSGPIPVILVTSAAGIQNAVAIR